MAPVWPQRGNHVAACEGYSQLFQLACSFLETEVGLDVAWDCKILVFPTGKCTFLTAQVGREQKCANALETKNIRFPAGRYTFLETEEGLDGAWEGKN